MARRRSAAHEHHVYQKAEDVPFVPDGHCPRIGNNVQLVRRAFRSVDETVYVQKTFTVYEPDQPKLLLQEARILQRARHTHVVRLVTTYFVDRKLDPHFAIIMERADANLEAYLTNKVSARKKRNIPQWFGCLVSAITHIHGFGIRHRDIKPSNILIRDGQVLLADFDISKMSLGKTMPTTVAERPRARTPAYCAPEVEDGSTRGRSADIFSLGAVFLEMVIAHSYFNKRQDLERVLTSQGTRGIRSYAGNVDLVHNLITNIQQERQEVWSIKLLSYCRKMLHVERDRRPLADELESAWSCLLPSDEPLAPCKCPVVESVGDEDKLLDGCKKGSLEEVQTLFANGADPNAVGAIHQASVRGFASIVQTFLHHNVDVNLQDYSKQTALHGAAGYGYTDIAEMLLEKDASVSLKDDEGQTALHCAAGQGRRSIVDMLIRKGADVQAVDDEGRTALHFAARRGHEAVVRLLLDSGADASNEDDDGRTALHFVAGYGCEKVVAMLLESLDENTINVKDQFGQTALHFAARGEHGKYNEITKLLEENGADITVKDCTGRTASWYMCQSRGSTNLQ